MRLKESEALLLEFDKPLMGVGVTPQKADQKLIEMVVCAIEDKTRDTQSHKLTIEGIDSEDTGMLRKIHLEEIKHKKLLMNIYCYLTGENYDANKKIENYPVGFDSPSRVFKQIMCAKLDSAEYFRKIYYAIYNISIRDMLMEIMMDEQAHAIKMSYLCNKYA